MKRQVHLMAILKHLTNKSSNYGKAIEYLIYQHNEFTQKPILDGNDNMQLREKLHIDGLNCQPLTFAKECEMLNDQFHKNQKADEIKSHHYIISFDPKDVENGLTGDRAQAIGLEFAQKYFAGHQALVCTHTDGHNHSGNIHVHIVINSLRKLDVDRQSFMERDYDCRAGYKHHQTRQYLMAMQEGLMTICEREHLHQVDLLSPAAAKVTDREYRLNQRRSHKAEITSDNSTPQSSGTRPFQSQKKYLQDVIREVASYAHSPEQFGADLKRLYGIQFKISRGRFSYLHPDRQKYMTGRTLGNDYTEDYLLPIFEGNRLAGRTQEEMIPSTNTRMDRHNNHSDPAKDSLPAYDPSYDYAADPIAVLHFHTRLKLVVDLQTCVKAQASRAYARKVKLTNLQKMAQTICFVQEHGIETRADLESLRDSIQQKLCKLQRQNPSYHDLHRQARELQVVCSNVDIILHSDPQLHHLTTEKAQSLD